jgi:hypothetical protein
LYFAPTACAVIRDHRPKQVEQGWFVQRIILANVDRPRGSIPLPLVDDAFGIGRDGILYKDGEMVPGAEQGADIPILLPAGERVDIVVNAIVRGIHPHVSPSRPTGVRRGRLKRQHLACGRPSTHAWPLCCHDA